jgi:hypothetical protein
MIKGGDEKCIDKKDADYKEFFIKSLRVNCQPKV